MVKYVVGGVQGFLMLKWLVHIITVVFKGLRHRFSIWVWCVLFYNHIVLVGFHPVLFGAQDQ